MKAIVLAGLGFVLAGAAWAEPPKVEASCIDPGKSYIALPVNNHDLYVKQTLGKPKPPVRVKTSCIHLEPALGAGFSRQFACIGMGDTVDVSINGGRPEHCRVTKVMPYAPEQGDFKQY